METHTSFIWEIVAALADITAAMVLEISLLDRRRRCFRHSGSVHIYCGPLNGVYEGGITMGL